MCVHVNQACTAKFNFFNNRDLKNEFFENWQVPFLYTKEQSLKFKFEIKIIKKS